jgi:arylsulfatase A-like enzyme
MTNIQRLGWRLVFLLAICAAAPGRAAVAAPASSAPPNVIFFLIDDLGWNDLGYTGGRFYESPNIDQLARRGVVFTRMYAAPICSPSRASLLTGLDPARTGMVSPRGDDALEVLQAHVQPRIYTEQELKKDRRKLPGGMQAPPNQRTLQVVSVSRLSTNYRSIARLFGAHGYRTAHFGKWHVGPTPYSPLEHGFDVNEPRVNSPGPLKPGHFGPWPDWPGEDGPANNAAQIDSVLAKHAVTFIHENKDRPFFLNFWTYGVHIPWQAEKKTIEHFRAKVASGIPGNAVHAAMIKHTDDAIGQVWQAVEAAGVAEKTIVVFLSDNGAGINAMRHPMLPERGVPITDNAPLRGGKGDIYEGGVRIPGFMIWPGVSRAGARCDLPVNCRDVLPTLAEMCGIHDLPPMDGRSVAPAVAGQAMPERPIFTHLPYYWNWSIGGGAPATSVVLEGWKLIRFYSDGPNQKTRHELYHLAEDPGETHDHSLRQPELVAKLDQLITAYARETGAVLPVPNPAYQEARTDTFEGLEYQLFAPSIRREGRYPLVVCLSGALDDGPENLERDNRGFAELQMTARQFLHPAFLLALRCPKGAQWVNGPAGEASYDLDAVAESPQSQKVLALVAKLLQEQHIEPRRVYLTGQGTGANGVWDLILRHPGVFAAAVPVGGGGSPKHAELIKDLPVWVFDCADSPSAAGSRAMAAALEAAGSTVARSTECAADGQMQLDNLWRHPVVRVGNAHRPVVPDWLFEQAQSASQQHRSP